MDNTPFHTADAINAMVTERGYNVFIPLLVHLSLILLSNSDL